MILLARLTSTYYRQAAYEIQVQSRGQIIFERMPTELLELSKLQCVLKQHKMIKENNR